jgi:hypothetical protein
VCCLDMLGYIFNNVFYPREFVICNDSVDISIEIESAFERKAITTSSLQWSYNFKKNNIHGLPLRWPTVPEWASLSRVPAEK